MPLFAIRKEAYMSASTWYLTGGKEKIRDKIAPYLNRGIGRIWLVNLDILPEGTDEKQLYEQMWRDFPCRLVADGHEQNIVLLVD